MAEPARRPAPRRGRPNGNADGAAEHGNPAIVEIITRLGFAIAAIFLMVLAAALIGVSIWEIAGSYFNKLEGFSKSLLDAVGYTIIAIAVFDVGKYLLEEEAIRAREMRRAAEARRSMTKFVSTIVIAVLLEALVAVFEAGKQDVKLMIYPTVLLLAGVALIVGLGIYQRLSASVERDVPEESLEAEDEKQQG